jgi:hypothetical protein
LRFIAPTFNRSFAVVAWSRQYHEGGLLESSPIAPHGRCSFADHVRGTLALCAALLVSVARAGKEPVLDRVIALVAVALAGISILNVAFAGEPTHE